MIVYPMSDFVMKWPVLLNVIIEVVSFKTKHILTP